MNIEQAGAKRRVAETEIQDANKTKLHADFAALKVAEAEAPSVRPLDPARFQEAQFARRQWCISLPVGVPFDQVYDPKFLKAVASKINIGDLVEVRSSDLTEWGMALCIDSDKNHGHARLVELVRKKSAGISTDETIHSEYTIEHTNDVVTGWQVIRTADKHIVRNGFKTKYDARYFINNDLLPRALS